MTNVPTTDRFDEALATYDELRWRLGHGPARGETCRLFPEIAARLRQLWNMLPVAPDPSPVSEGGTARQAPELPAVPGYELLHVLGHGGAGVVYKARQLTPNRTVALKLLKLGIGSGPADLARFRAEAEAAGQLHHPNLVTVFAAGPTESEPTTLPYIAQEYVEGPTLAQRLTDGPLPPRLAAQLVEMLARAVAVANEHGIVHRDLKPGNVLLEQRHDRVSGIAGLGMPKITDFGLAKWYNRNRDVSQLGEVIGTPAYMAPEQAFAQKDVGPPADVYALGIILYECLAGHPPFQNPERDALLKRVRFDEPPPLRRVAAHVERDLATITHKCLEKEPDKRYGSAAALADDLRRFLDGRPIVARPVSTVEHAWRRCRRKPAIALLAAALVVTVATGLSFALVLGRQAMISEARALKGEAKALANLEQEKAARRETEEHYTRLRGMVGNVIQPGRPSSLWELGANPWRAMVMDEADSCLSFLVQRRDPDPELRELLAVVLVQQGAIRVAQHLDTEAQMVLERAARLWERSPAGESHNPEVRAWHTITYAYLEQIYERQGRLSLARQSFGSAFRTWQELVKGPPDLHSMYFLENALLDLGWVVIDGGFPEKGVARRLEGVRDHLQRLGGGPECDLFFDLARVGYLRAETQKLEAARQKADVLAAAREAASILDRLLQRTDLPRYARCQMACMTLYFSMYLRRAEALDEALRLSERANGTLRDLLQKDPGEYYFLNTLCRSWQEIAKIRWNLGQTEETLTACRKALEAQRQAFTLFPTLPEAREALGWCHDQLGRKLCELGRLDEAEACYRERQALWLGDAAKQAEAVADLRKWAAGVGNDKNNLSPEQKQERQRYLDLCARLEGKPAGSLPVSGNAKP